MDFEATRRIQPEMASTERLLWTGRPPQGLRFRKKDVPTAILGMVWTGFAVFWTWSVWQEESDLMPALFGGLMVLIGLYQFIGQFFLEAVIRARTWYGVSDLRVVILTEAPARSVQSMDLAELPDVTLEAEGIDGGVIQFGADDAVTVPAAGYPGRRRRRRAVGRRGPYFELESGARSAFEIIHRAQSDVRKTS
jgi:hypothetical protein